MNDDAANLDRLHDLAMPPEVAWWPLAPGWYAVIGIILAASVAIIYQVWRKWQADAYRREALLALEDASDTAGVAEILRRTALAVAPRQEVAGKLGNAWLDWLSARLPEPMPEDVRAGLSAGVYAPSGGRSSFPAVRDYAVSWIKSHQI